MKAIRLFITGRVQGVFFRAETERFARDLEVVGYVKNLPDGRVEVYAEGSESDLEKLIDWCSEGPDVANVDHIKEQWVEPTGGYDEFGTVY